MTLSQWPDQANGSPATIETAVQLAIETTGQTGSVAILEGENVLFSHQLGDASRTAASLAPAMSDAISWCSENDKSLHFVSVAAGPGSFTGLRIGVTTAKTFCYAKALPMVAVDSLAAIAATIFTSPISQNQKGAVSTLVVGLNAYRKQTFTSRFTRSQLLPALDHQVDGVGAVSSIADPAESGATKILDESQWGQYLATLCNATENDDTHFCGDAKVFDAVMAGLNAGRFDGARFVERSGPDAVGVGLVAIRSAARGQFSDPLSLTPRYLKASAAEEKLLAGPSN